jgi:hypothetical protein
MKGKKAKPKLPRKVFTGEIIFQRHEQKLLVSYKDSRKL